MKRSSKKKKKKSKRKIAAEDYFHKLPDELLILIFNKLGDTTGVKFLCQCSLVSKRFASTIPLIPTLSLTNPPISGRVQFQKILNKFQKIHFLEVDYALDGITLDDFKYNWKIVFGTQINTIACLVFTPITRDGAADESNHILQELEILVGVLCKVILTIQKYEDLFFLVAMHKMLQSVVITSRMNWKIRMGGEQLVKLRSGILGFLTSRKRVKFAVLPVLRLPLSGLVMKGVSLYIIRTGEELLDNDDADDDMLNWDFEEDEKVFGEALTLILKNHKHKISRVDQ